MNTSYVASINENAARYLYKTANWTTFFSILGFIFAGLMIILSLGMILGGGLITRLNPAMAQMPFNFGLLGLIYLPFAALYIWVSVLMLGFASKAKQALKMNDDEMIEQSFRKMNRFLAVMGISTIVVLALYVIGMIAFFISVASGTLGAMS